MCSQLARPSRQQFAELIESAPPHCNRKAVYEVLVGQQRVIGEPAVVSRRQN
jgi:hypothetical protein